MDKQTERQEERARGSKREHEGAKGRGHMEESRLGRREHEGERK